MAFRWAESSASQSILTIPGFLSLVCWRGCWPQATIPQEFPGWATSEYWVMGFVTAVLLFVSVLIHELAHSLVAQHYGTSRSPHHSLSLRRSLPACGRAASPSSRVLDHARRPVDESCVGRLLLGVGAAGCPLAAALRIGRVSGPLNLVLAIFNLIPGFPARWRPRLSRHRLAGHRQLSSRHR